jgi:hypothetical protein
MMGTLYKCVVTEASPMSTLYLNPLGFTSRRPASLPPIDRRALMRNAHRIAKGFRTHFASYRAALAYGLSAAWKQAQSNRTIQSLALQVARPASPIASHRSTIRRPMLGSYAFVGA